MILHALTDHRRMLPVERLGTTLGRTRTSCWSSRTTRATRRASRTSSRAPGNGSWPSSSATRGRAGDADHRPRGPCDASVAASLAFLGDRLRNLDEADLIDGPSTRLLVYVGALIRKGVAPRRACDVAPGAGGHRRPGRAGRGPQGRACGPLAPFSWRTFTGRCRGGPPSSSPYDDSEAWPHPDTTTTIRLPARPPVPDFYLVALTHRALRLHQDPARSRRLTVCRFLELLRHRFRADGAGDRGIHRS